MIIKEKRNKYMSIKEFKQIETKKEEQNPLNKGKISNYEMDMLFIDEDEY